jgi:hypothetical protein
MASKAANTGVDPLKELLGDVLARLEILEANAGGSGAVTSATKSPVPVKPTFHGTSCWSIRRRFEIVKYASFIDISL